MLRGDAVDERKKSILLKAPAVGMTKTPYRIGVWRKAWSKTGPNIWTKLNVGHLVDQRFVFSFTR